MLAHFAIFLAQNQALHILHSAFIFLHSKNIITYNVYVYFYENSNLIIHHKKKICLFMHLFYAIFNIYIYFYLFIIF